MRNSFLSDLLRFASPTQSQNFPSSVDGIDCDCNSNGVADNRSVYHSEKPNFPNLTYLGALQIQSTNRSDFSFVGTEIDEHLRRDSQMSFEDSPINVDSVVMVNDGDDDLLIPENMLSIQGNDTSTLENEEVLPEAGERAKDKRRLISSAGGQANGDNVTAQVNFPKLKGMENIIPDSTSEGSDAVTVLEDAAKYIRTLKRKREFLRQRVDQQMFMYSEELSLKAQNGKFPAFKPVHSKPKSMYPFILPALPHEILSSPPERQGAFRQFTPGTSMCLSPLPDQLPLPDSNPLPDLHEQVQPLPPWEDELQKLVNQTFR